MGPAPQPLSRLRAGGGQLLEFWPRGRIFGAPEYEKKQSSWQEPGEKVDETAGQDVRAGRESSPSWLAGGL